MSVTVYIGHDLEMPSISYFSQNVSSILHASVGVVSMSECVCVCRAYAYSFM